MDNRRVAAIIGCGVISLDHSRGYFAIRDQVRVKYFCDLIPEKAERRKNEFGDEGSIVTTDWQDVLNDPEVEMVSVCLPNCLHAPFSIALLEAGKHVLCEKPASVNLENTLKMKEAADKSGKLLSIGVCNRYSANVRKIREMILSGELGEVYQVYCSFRSFRSIPALGKWFTTKEKSGGGVVFDWGVHFFDLIDYVLGSPAVKAVSAVTHSKLGCDIPNYHYRGMHSGPADFNGVYDVEEFATGIIRTEGACITFNGAWAQNIDEEELFVEFIGTKAGIRLRYGADFTVYCEENGEFKSYVPEVHDEDFIVVEIAEFADACKNGTKTCGCIDNFIQTAKLMDAIYESSASGHEVVF